MSLEFDFDMIKSSTRDDFHDSVLIEWNIKFSSKEIGFVIEHLKDNQEGTTEIVIQSTILFKDVKSISVVPDISFLLFREDIDSILLENINGINFFKICGIDGWIIKFSAGVIEYHEEIVGEWKGD